MHTKRLLTGLGGAVLLAAAVLSAPQANAAPDHGPDVGSRPHGVEGGASGWPKHGGGAAWARSAAGMHIAPARIRNFSCIELLATVSLN